MIDSRECPSTTLDRTSHRVITVGYGYTTNKNALDMDGTDGILDAIREAGKRLPYPDGNDSPYLPSSTNIIMIKGATYLGPIIIGTWIHLVADGDVTIQGVDAGGQVISVSKVPLDARAPDVVPKVQIGKRSTIGPLMSEPSTFRILPSQDDQRGLVSIPNQLLDINDTTFAGFRVHGSGAAISNIFGTLTNCTFENCHALTDSTGYGSGGAISGGISVSAIVLQGESKPRGNRSSLKNCHFTNCTAEVNGGAVEQLQAVVDGCTFTECVAAGSGGACFRAGKIDSATFARCSATGDGGARSMATVGTNVTCPTCAAVGSR
ncbi:MAG: hypothetical protein IT198_16110, partial [Acidimicrobiia bacterium]|nr:hypothetical protein [Acidimicrobiia bacterium]